MDFGPDYTTVEEVDAGLDFGPDRVVFKASYLGRTVHVEDARSDFVVYPLRRCRALDI